MILLFSQSAYALEPMPSEQATLQYKPRTLGQYFEDLPRHIGNDLKESVWNIWHIVAITAGAVGTVALNEADPDIQE